MTNRYRPDDWDELVGQPTDEIRALMDGRNTPNFLFYGPPGTGKTATAHLIAETIQGDDKELMTFNSSDERGIDTVRENVIPATGQTTLTGAPRVIFLDEMESMTKEAQQALRAPMEQSDAVFILACNEIDAVHEAIRSRCYDYEFGELSSTAIRKRLRQVADEYGVTITKQQRKMIVGFANGDMRKALQRFDQYATGAVPEEAQVAPGLSDGNQLEQQSQSYLGNK